MSFCVKCGRDCEESLDGLCIDCWLDGRKLTSLPHHVDLRVCTNCGEYEFGDRWLRREKIVAVQDAAADALAVIRDAVPVSVSTQAVEQDPHVYSVTVRTTCDVMGYEAEDEATTIVRIKNTVCRRCSRQLGSYYEAILQIRTGSGRLSEEDREETLAMVENSVARQAATNRSLFITKMELVTGGVDVYLSSMSLGKSLASWWDRPPTARTCTGSRTWSGCPSTMWGTWSCSRGTTASSPGSTATAGGSWT